MKYLFVHTTSESSARWRRVPYEHASCVIIVIIIAGICYKRRSAATAHGASAPVDRRRCCPCPRRRCHRRPGSSGRCGRLRAERRQGRGQETRRRSTLFLPRRQLLVMSAKCVPSSSYRRASTTTATGRFRLWWRVYGIVIIKCVPQCLRLCTRGRLGQFTTYY